MAIASFGMNIIESPYLNPLNSTQLPWEVCTLNQRIKKIASAVLPLTVAFVLANSLGGSIVAYLGVLTINALVSKLSNSIFYKSENLNDNEIKCRKSITLTRDKVISMLNRGIKDFRYYNFTAADLRGANLTGADLTGAYLRKANLTEVNLREAKLSRATLRGANLTGADLTEANLTMTNLTEANLTEAELNEASLTETNLTGADLTEVNLTGAIFANTHITREQYETIKNTPFKVSLLKASLKLLENLRKQ